MGDNENALKKGEEGLKICQKEKDIKGESVILNNFGAIHGFLGNYPNALDYYQKSLKINEKLGNLKAMRNCCLMTR